jgi:chemotaxis protein MotB
MRPEGYPILQVIGKALGTLSKQIDHIEIDGHTAKVSSESTSNYFSWQLSADRAIEVLKFLVIKCGLPQDKMSVAGFSHYVPVTGNDTEKERAQNRRVEIRITSIHDAVAVDVATKN